MVKASTPFSEHLLPLFIVVLAVAPFWIMLAPDNIAATPAPPPDQGPSALPDKDLKASFTYASTLANACAFDEPSLRGAADAERRKDQTLALQAWMRASEDVRDHLLCADVPAKIVDKVQQAIQEVGIVKSDRTEVRGRRPLAIIPQ
jgi:hypothetical protein